MRTIVAAVLLTTSLAAQAATLVKDFAVGAPGSSPVVMELAGMPIVWAQNKLWRIDGTRVNALTSALPAMHAEHSSGYTFGDLLCVRLQDRIANCRQVGNPPKTVCDMHPQVLFTNGTKSGTYTLEGSPTVSPLGFKAGASLGAALVVGGDSSSFIGSLDGTAKGLKYIRFVSGAAPRIVMQVGKWVLFTDSSGRHLSSTDGTKIVSLGDLSPSHFLRVNDEVWFRGKATLYGEELWRTNGTFVGTRMVKDVRDGGFGSFPTPFGQVGGKVIFMAFDNQFWISDGSPNGTKYLTKSSVGCATTFFCPKARNGVTLEDRIVFLVNVPVKNPGGITADVLMTSDGTAAGTVPLGSFPQASDLLAVGTRLAVFGSSTDGKTVALWQTDGTRAGTKKISDTLAVGTVDKTAGVQLPSIRATGGRLYFAADDGKLGKELWSIDLPAHQARVGLGCSGRPWWLRLDCTPPTLGTTMRVRVAGGTPAASGLFVLSGTGAPIRRVGTNCSVYADLQNLYGTLAFQLDKQGAAETTAKLPNITTMIGEQIMLQAAVANPTTNPFGADLSNGLRLSLGR